MAIVDRKLHLLNTDKIAPDNDIVLSNTMPNEYIIQGSERKIRMVKRQKPISYIDTLDGIRKVMDNEVVGIPEGIYSNTIGVKGWYDCSFSYNPSGFMSFIPHYGGMVDSIRRRLVSQRFLGLRYKNKVTGEFTNITTNNISPSGIYVGNKMIYSNALYDDVTLKYEVRADSVKQFIILHKDFIDKLDSPYPHEDTEVCVINEVLGDSKYYDGIQKKGWLDETSVDDFQMSIVNLSDDYGMDYLYIKSAKTEAVLDDTLTDQMDSSDKAASYYSSSNYGGSGTMYAGHNSVYQIGILSWDLSSIGSDNAIDDADMSIWVSGPAASWLPPPHVTIELRRVTDEGTGDWNETQVNAVRRTSSQDWNQNVYSINGGGDYSSSEIVTKTSTATAVGHEENITGCGTMIGKWVDGTYTNYGWGLFAPRGLSGDYYYWDSDNGSTAGERPKLTVNYHLEGWSHSFLGVSSPTKVLGVTSPTKVLGVA